MFFTHERDIPQDGDILFQLRFPYRMLGFWIKWICS